MTGSHRIFFVFEMLMWMSIACRFALKSFSKVKVLQAGSAQDVLDELVVMAQLHSPFCCRLIQRFHDANCV